MIRLPRPPRFEKVRGLTEHFLRIQQEIEQAFARVVASDRDANFSGGVFFQDIETGITASTTQTQGQRQLSATVNRVDTVANANDVVTLPPCVRGKLVLVEDLGANNLQVFPASGDKIGSNAVNTSITLTASNTAMFVGTDDTTWLYKAE